MLLSEMTNPKRGKRERLVASASDLLHRNGVQATTLAQVATAADVPPGNVYYYFKTKDDLVRAVIEARVAEARTLLAEFQREPDPVARLKALTREWAAMGESAARYGCPFGTLASELDRRDDGLDRAAAEPMAVIIDWAEARFRELGRDDARELAVTLFAGVQGGALLANAFRDPEVMTGRVRHLDEWLDTLA
jgi:TetR/AcrR family transcriptional regulator, transcriptional repressor for nem operon